MVEDRDSMLAFPGAGRHLAAVVDPPAPNDYVRVDTNDYLVDRRFVGGRVEVRVNLETLVVTCEGTEVARHRLYGN